MKKLALITLLSFVFLVGCSSSIKDGEYTGSYQAEDSSSSMTVTLTIKDGEITACEMTAYDKTGAVKDENYGKNAGEENYKLAQTALKGMKQYPALLVETQNVDDIDAISGASVSLQEFRAAVKDALNSAK